MLKTDKNNDSSEIASGFSSGLIWNDTHWYAFACSACHPVSSVELWGHRWPRLVCVALIDRRENNAIPLLSWWPGLGRVSFVSFCSSWLPSTRTQMCTNHLESKISVRMGSAGEGVPGRAGSGINALGCWSGWDEHWYPVTVGSLNSSLVSSLDQ